MQLVAGLLLYEFSVIVCRVLNLMWGKLTLPNKVCFELAYVSPFLHFINDDMVGLGIIKSEIWQKLRVLYWKAYLPINAKLLSSLLLTLQYFTHICKFADLGWFAVPLFPVFERESRIKNVTSVKSSMIFFTNTHTHIHTNIQHVNW